MRIDEMTTNLGKALISLHILPTNSLKNIQISLENLYVDIGA